MQIEYDEGKDSKNQRKHGISLSQANRFEFDTAAHFTDKREEYGKARYVSIGYIEDRLYVMVWTKRTEALRIISLRKANKRERTRYERQKKLH